MKCLLAIALALTTLLAFSQNPEIEGHNQLALQLLAAKHKPGENLILSPFNIYSNLAILSTGAASEAEEELRKVLGSKDPAKTVASFQTKFQKATDHKVISIGNSIWVKRAPDVLPEFKERFKRDFNGEQQIIPVDLPEAVKKINDWISVKTENKIKEALTVDDLETVEGALINTILFKGTWVTPFDPEATREDKFELSRGGTTPAMFMNKHMGLGLFRADRFSLYELPFNDSLSFVISTGNRSMHVDQLIEEMLKDPLVISYFETQTEIVELSLPKFKFGYKTQLIPALEKIGVHQVFATGALSKMFAHGSGLYLNKMIHNAAIEMNEKGVEAAAVTVAGVARSMPTIVKMNRPFVFFILSKPSNIILFEGVLEVPVSMP